MSGDSREHILQQQNTFYSKRTHSKKAKAKAEIMISRPSTSGGSRHRQAENTFYSKRTHSMHEIGRRGLAVQQQENTFYREHLL